MITGDVLTGVIAVIIGYLLGSIPFAYIVTRIVTGKDIRRLGGGNVGARNTYLQAGWAAGIIAGVFDVAKGVAAVVIAHNLLGLDKYFVLATGLAAVSGHIWSIYLKFTGGNGLSPTIGILSVLLTRELGIAFALTLVFIVITHNPILSINISLLSVPVSAWFIERELMPVFFSLILLLIMVLHFLPTAQKALVQAGNKENFFFELLRMKKVKAKKS